MQSLLETSMPPPAGVSVPGRPDELTSEWLTACLRHAGALSSSERVAEFTARRIGEGHGFAGIILRLELQYASITEGGDTAAPGARAPRRLVAKFATEHEPTRAMLVAFEGYAREVRFYRDVATRAGIPTPRCYFAHYDRPSASFLLLLEDMAPASAVEFGGRPHLPAVRTAAVAPRGDARAFLVSPRSRGVRAARRAAARGLRSLRRGGAGFRGALRRALPARHAGVTLRRSARQGRRFRRSGPAAAADLTHQDLHIDNVLLPSAEGGRFALIDWQSVAASRHGVADIARVLGTCVTPELRRKHGPALLRGYHERLRAFGVRGYGLSTLRYRLRQEMAAMVVVAVLALQTLDLDNAQGARAASVLMGRIESAVEDARVILPLHFMVLLFTLRRAVRRWLRALAPSARE